MQLKTQTDYAMRIMLYLAKHREGTRKEMSAALGINEHYLPKIAKPLREKGWISSTSGSVGGFRMEADPDRVSLLDIIEAIEGPMKISQSIGEDYPCNRGSAVSDPVQKVREVYRVYEEHVEEYFSAVSLQSLIES